eukprot:symbB.v1.2.034047.t1/scaffold4326.1/size41202/2
MEPTGAGTAYKEALTFCQPFKDRYDKCFNVWYRQGFLRHQLNNPCDDQFEDYKACILEELRARGLRLPGSQTSGQPPDPALEQKVVAQTKSKSVQLYRILIVPMARALCFGLGAWFAAGATVHPERQALLAKLQEQTDLTWTPGIVERFASDAPGSSKIYGVKGNVTQAIQSAIQRGELERVLFEGGSDLPDNFDSAEQWPECSKMINDIRDQSNCGCCWAFAGAEAASDRMCIATKGKTMVPISAQDVCFNSESDGCDGGMIDTPWSYIKSTGAVSGGQYQGTGPFGKGLCSDFSLPHCHHHGPQGKDPYPAEGKPGCPSESSPQGPTKCDATAKAPHDDFQKDKYSYQGKTQTASGEKAIQQMIMQGGPVETAFTVYSDFELYTKGIYKHVSGSAAGGHAVRMVGWGVDNGVKYWKIANSWNPYWGEKGFFRIIRGTNEGGIEDQVIGSSPDATWTHGKTEAQIVV